jgi:ribosomal-protein-alanine N-acetyltransferase
MDDWNSWASVRRESRAFLTPWEPTWSHDSLTQQAFRRRLRVQQRERLAGTSCGLLIFERHSGDVIGGITIADIRRGVAMACSIGYWIGTHQAHQGYMTEAVAAVLSHIFDTLRLHRVEAACLPNNEASRRLLMKLGFREEGLARSYLKIDGRWQDHRLFAILDTEWREHRGFLTGETAHAALAGD